MNTLVLVIKNPIKGKAKTRLAATVGDDEALRIYLELLKHTRNVSLQINAKRYLYYSHFINEADEWSNTDFIKKLQKGEDLGERLTNAVSGAYETSEERIIVMGSDCASLTASILEEAFFQLEHHDFVVGPATDGGYYLLGMRQLDVSVFQGINWSTATTLSETINIIEKQQKTYYRLPTLSDIDYEEDWVKYGW